MQKLDLLGIEMWECTPAEAKKIWMEDIENRWRITSHAEVDAHILDGPEEIMEWIEKKKVKPGQYL